MKRPLFQTSIRNLLLATFWFGVAVGSWSALHRIQVARVPSQVEVPLTWVLMIAPFAATGALIGRAKMGLAVGTLSVTLFWLVWRFT